MNIGMLRFPAADLLRVFAFIQLRRIFFMQERISAGFYRYDHHFGIWKSLMDHVKLTEKWESYPLSIAVDTAHPNWLKGVKTLINICRSTPNWFNHKTNY
jgi:hypothetical protein